MRDFGRIENNELAIVTENEREIEFGIYKDEIELRELENQYGTFLHWIHDDLTCDLHHLCAFYDYPRENSRIWGSRDKEKVGRDGERVIGEDREREQTRI